MNKLLMGLVVASLAIGCGKSAEGDPAEKKTEAKADTKKGAAKKAPESKAPATKAAAAPAAKAWLPMADYGIQLEVPAGAKAAKSAGSSFMINSPKGQCTVMLNKKNDMAYFPSYDSAKKTIDKGIGGKMKAMIKEEKKDADNWTFFYTKESMMDPAKSKFAVDVRTKVGEGIYSCGRVTNSKADAECVLHACNSIKPL